MKDDNAAIRNTILLLNDAYYGTTPQKKMEARIIRKTLRKDLSKFKEYVREYQEAENEEEKAARFSSSTCFSRSYAFALEIEFKIYGECVVTIN